MTLGEKHIKENYIKEVSYEKAIEISIIEAKRLGIKSREDIYDNDSIFDSPIYPCNAELYDEFCDEYGFDTTEYFLFIAKRMEYEK
jgi:hypothetical protein